MKLYELCLTPVILAGLLSTVEIHSQVSKHTQQTTGQGVILEALTCETGLGAGIKTSTNGLHAIEAIYGIQGNVGPLTMGLIPKLGMSYASHTVKELPQGTQFSLGLQFLLGYDSLRLGVEYWHMSNGSALGLNTTDNSKHPNIGLDLVSIQTGFAF